MKTTMPADVDAAPENEDEAPGNEDEVPELATAASIHFHVRITWQNCSVDHWQAEPSVQNRVLAPRKAHVRDRKGALVRGQRSVRARGEANDALARANRALARAKVALARANRALARAKVALVRPAVGNGVDPARKNRDPNPNAEEANPRGREAEARKDRKAEKGSVEETVEVSVIRWKRRRMKVTEGERSTKITERTEAAKSG